MIKIILGIYGALLLVGGFFGLKAGSKVSLIMGLASGVCVFLGLWLANTNPVAGYRLLTGITAILVLTFISRLLKTHAFMPAGMLLFLSLIAFVVCLLEIFKK